MTTHSHARGGSKTPHPIRGAYPSPSALQGICLPACLPTRTADRRRPRRSKDWGARRSAACRSPFARQCQAHPCHGHAASRRRPLCACLLPCQTDPLAFRCRHPPCRLPACSALPACLPACLPVPACLPAASHVGSPAPSTLSGSPACPPSTLSGSPACPPCLVPSGAPPRVLACPPAYHLPLLHLPCQTDRLAFRLPPSAVLPACHPAHRLAGGSPAPSPLGGSPACLPCLMPPTVRLARRSACADRPIPPASRLPPPSLLCRVSHRLLRPSVCRRLPCRRLRRLPATPHGGPPAPSTLGESLASLPCPSRGGSPRTFACLPTCAEACPHRDRAANRQRPSCHPAAVPPPANLCHVVPPSSAMRRRSPPPVAPATPAEPRHKRADPKATRRNGQPSQPSTPPPSSPPPLRLPAILPLASLPATSSPACLPALSAAPTSDAAAPPSSTSPPCLPTDPAARAACQPCRCSCWPIPALSAPSLQACLLIRGDAPLPVRPCSAPPRGASDLPKKTKARRTSSRALVSYRRDARA